MMKRALMAALCFSFVTLGSQAIDINIPGADPTISKGCLSKLSEGRYDREENGSRSGR